MLKKLACYGVRGVALKLITSYLANRTQYVQLDTPSKIKSVKIGVPQGSILGSLLFNIYINDIVNVDYDTKYVIYADDTTLLFKSSNVMTLIQNANSVLKSIHEWCVENGLKINTSKTKAVLFHAINKNITIEADLNLASSKIEIVSSMKTLGVWFDEHMIRTAMCTVLPANFLKSWVHFLVCRYLPHKIKLRIYNAFFPVR